MILNSSLLVGDKTSIKMTPQNKEWITFDIREHDPESGEPTIIKSIEMYKRDFLELINAMLKIVNDLDKH